MSKHTVIFMSSPKGGSGQSTITWNMAVMWAQRGYKVALLDLDRNQICSTISVRRQYRQRRGERDLPNVKVHEPLRGILTESLHSLTEEFEITIIDGGSFFDKSTPACLEFTDFIVLPVLAQGPDIDIVLNFWPKLLGTLQPLRRSIPINVIINGVGDMRDNAASLTKQLTTLSHANFLQQVLHRRSVYQRSLEQGMAVNEMWSLGDNDEKAVAEFQSLFDEFNRSANL